MIENRLLRHALALGEHRNFARAAQALHLTQPTLSRSIALLERTFGVKLFDRTTKGVAPTVFGRMLLERGADILRNEATLRREMSLLAGLEDGELAVGAGPYLAESTVAVAIGRLSRAHPGLRLKCFSADPLEVVRAVLAEEIDIGVAAMPKTANDARLNVEPLSTEPAYLACRPGHPLTRERSMTLARALEFPLVTTVLRGPLAALAYARGKAAAPMAVGELEFVPPILVNTVAAARTIARESDAIVPGIAGVLVDDVAAGRLVILDIDQSAMRSLPAIVHLRERTLSPAARKFIAILRGLVSDEARAADDLMSDAIARGRRAAAQAHPAAPGAVLRAKPKGRPAR